MVDILHEQQRVAEVLTRYATGIDRRDWDLFRSCFTVDVHADYGAAGSWESLDAITAFMTTVHADMGHTMHRLSNMAIDVDGDAAAARSYVDAFLVLGDGKTAVNAIGFYDDDLVRTDEGWRIARRNFTQVHVRTLDV
jgi:3-phenylpropionate/cinnamic acid dioxygenase small subunit